MLHQVQQTCGIEVGTRTETRSQGCHSYVSLCDSRTASRVAYNISIYFDYLRIFVGTGFGAYLMTSHMLCYEALCWVPLKSMHCVLYVELASCMHSETKEPALQRALWTMTLTEHKQFDTRRVLIYIPSNCILHRVCMSG